MYDEVDDIVRITDRRASRPEAENIADEFEDTADEGENGEGFGTVEVEADAVGDEDEGVED